MVDADAQEPGHLRHRRELGLNLAGNGVPNLALYSQETSGVRLFRLYVTVPRLDLVLEPNQPSRNPDSFPPHWPQTSGAVWYTLLMSLGKRFLD
jgi:hypothetical protein